MNHYILLVKGGTGLLLHKLNGDGRRDYFNKWKKWLRSLKQKGCLVAGSPLVIEGTALYHSGETITVPDNYDLASETITGFCIIEAESPEYADRILISCPFLQDEFTSCELRAYKNLS